MNARGVAIEAAAGEFRVVCSAGEFAAGALVVATGGLSIPKMGATGLAYDLARQFGLKVIQPRAALVPLVLTGAEKGWTELAGVSADVTAQATRGPKFREKMLVTHRGLSGPAVLQASSYWRPGEAIEVDFAPDVNGQSRLLASLLEAGSPARCGRVQTGAARCVAPTACRASGGGRRSGRLVECGTRSGREQVAPMGVPACRDRGIREGRGDGGWRGYRWAQFENDGGAQRAGPLFHWRRRGCYRAPGRIQLPVGVGLGGGGGVELVVTSVHPASVLHFNPALQARRGNLPSHWGKTSCSIRRLETVITDSSGKASISLDLRSTQEL